MEEIKNKIICIMILFLCSGLCACKKEVDGSGDQDSLAQSLAVYQYIPRNTDTVFVPLNLMGIPVANTGFPALLRNAAGSDVEVTAKIDTDIALTEAFNKLYNIASPPLSQNLFRLAGNGNVTIKAGHTMSADSFKVHLDKLTGLSAGVYKYAVPLRLSSGTAGATLASTLMFIRFDIIVVDWINVDQRNKDLNGIRIDRAAWHTTASSEGRGLTDYALDGNNLSAWTSSATGLPQWFQLDMGKVHAVKGFSIVPNYGDFTTNDDLLKMDILSSNDGVIWKTEGTYKGPRVGFTNPSNPEFKTVKFISPVTARYFKFNVTSSSSGTAAGMAELYGIE